MALFPGPSTTPNAASAYLTCEGREIHFMDWGPKDAPAIVMWHGLARTGRDFDTLARALAGRYRIVAPDTLGRGLSQWADDPASEYSLDFYARIAHALCDRLGLDRLAWIGTSMGGALGIRLAATAMKGRIERLLVNDIGPELPAPAVERILTYAGKPPRFARVSELESYLRKIYVPFGRLTDAEWRSMAESSARRLPDGGITTHYDPRMVEQFVQHPHDYTQWEEWQALTLPVLVLRGGKSDLLTPEIAARMSVGKPNVEIVEVAGCGHAPALNVPEQIATVTRFLEA